MPKYGDINFCPHLNATGIRTALLATGTISTAKIAANAISTAKIRNFNVTASKVATGAITTVKLAALAVSTAKIKSYGVTATKIATGAVATAKIAAGAVSKAKIAALAVSTAKVATGAITNAKVGNGTLSLGSLTDGSNLGKLNAVVQRFTTAASNTIVSVAHGLGRTPVGWIVLWQNKAANLYQGTTAWAGATNARIMMDQQTVAAAVAFI